MNYFRKRSAGLIYSILFTITIFFIIDTLSKREQKILDVFDEKIEVPKHLLWMYEEYKRKTQHATSNRKDIIQPMGYSPKYLLVKIVTNNFPPLQTNQRILYNVHSVKTGEKLPEDFHRIWVLHSILDDDLMQDIWRTAFTDQEMTLAVPSPFEHPDVPDNSFRSQNDN